ncbi:MAG: carboxypeptidase regulatory-like domain-containing protein [Clostridiaceae bacterium]
MATIKDIYKLGQSEEGSIVQKGEEIRIDLDLQDNILSNTGSVSGTVVDENNNPVPGAIVKITDSNYVPKYHAITNDNGEYIIDNVEAGTEYSVLANKDSYTIEEGTTFVMQEGQQIERDFTIIKIDSTNSFLAGEILDKDDVKLEGATVNLYETSGDTPVLVKNTISNAFGQYVFLDLPLGSYTVESYLLGYTNTSSNFVVDKDNQMFDIDLLMLDDPISKLGTINGIIKDKDGKAIPAASVVLFEVTIDSEGKEVLTAIRRTLTNDEGLYLFEEVPQGDYKIKANKLSE